MKSRLNVCPLLLDSRKARFQILNQVLIIFNPNGEAQKVVRDAQFLAGFFG